VDDEVVLKGGVANAGAVTRQGSSVLRPSNPHTAAIHALLRHVRRNGFDGVPLPEGVDADGRERLEYISGDVPVPPFPRWSQSEQALASTAALLRRFHDAQDGFVAPSNATWSDELADPEGGLLICHNDVCPENVVYREATAVALLDFDFAAPGRPEYDLAQLAKMCVPLDTDEDAARLGRGGLDPFARLRVVTDGYGLPPDRSTFVDILDEVIRTGGDFVRRRVERGEPAFVAMWNDMGGQQRYDRRYAWFTDNRQRFLDALA
jgi:thiamine kinase-like enzyme